MRPLTKFVSGLSLEPEGQGQRRSGEDEGPDRGGGTAWGFPICVTRSNEFGWAGDLQRMRFRRLRSCRHDTMEFVAFALGYPRKFDRGRCATGAGGWQTVAAAGCGLFGVSPLRKTGRLANEEPPITRVEIGDPWRSHACSRHGGVGWPGLIGGPGGPGNVAKNKVTVSKTPHWAACVSPKSGSPCNAPFQAA